VAGEFIVMAANLIYLKSRTMLPVSVQPPEEEAEEEDPRWNWFGSFWNIRSLGCRRSVA